MRSLVDNDKLRLRKAVLQDALLVYKWATDPAVRTNSISQEIFPFSDHINWFEKKIIDPSCEYFILESYCPHGQVRLDSREDHVLISLQIDACFQGFGLAAKMLRMAMDKHGPALYHAQVKNSNIPSLKLFRNLGFREQGMIENTNDLILFIYEKH